MLPNPTLDQLQVFLAVVEKGSFSAASRALNRTQSVISYTIANLEDQLGVALFHRLGTRRPTLTDAGKSALEDARRLLADLDMMRARVKALGEGIEAELSVAISVLVPSDAVVRAIRAFRARYPLVTLNVQVGTLAAVVDALIHERAVVGFGGGMEVRNDLLVAERIGHSSMVPVAAPDHALVKLQRELTLADIRNETQLVVSDATGLSQGRDFNVLSIKTWRVSDIATKHLFIREGLGWGGLPAPLVRQDLAEGRLVHLPLPAYAQGQYAIYSISKVASPLGPAARWLIAELRNGFARSVPDNDREEK